MLGAGLPCPYPPTLMLVLQNDAEELFTGIITLVALLAVYAVFGIVCAVVAPSRGRSAVAWLFIGVATQCLGIVLIFVLPNLKEEQEKQRRRDEETRRLREQLKKERQVADQRHDVVHGRLGAHDLALGLDSAAALPGPAPTPPPSQSTPPQLAAGAEPVWHFALGSEQLGPVAQSRLQQMWVNKEIGDDTLVWRQGMASWVRITEVVDLFGRPGQNS